MLMNKLRTLYRVLLFSTGLILSYASAAQQSAAEASDADTAATSAEEIVLQIELPERTGDLLDAIRQRGELQVGVSAFTPWAMRNADGELIGYEIDIARQLADDLGVDLKLVPTSWSNIISDLLDGHYDIIVSGLSVTPERALQVEFSTPYHYSEVLLLANKSKVSSLTELEPSELTIGVRPDTTAASLAERHFPAATRQTFDDEDALYEAVRKGEVHAVMGSSPRPTIEALRYPEQVYLPMANSAGSAAYLARTGEGFALRKGNQSLLNYLNAWIQYHSVSGFLDDKDGYWFRSLDWEKLL